MKVRGFKTRVQLSEEQLEHVEEKPGTSLAPVIAVLVWVASMAVAAAIHFSWLPLGGSSAEVELPANPSQALQEPSRVQPGSVHREAPPPQPPEVAEALEPEGTVVEAPVASTADGASEEPPLPTAKRDRKIRGSYAGAGRDWLAGW